jgi:anti-sigma factor RsiW
MHDLLHAYVDGELDLAHTLDVERHLETCPGCARACEEIRGLRAALKTSLPRFQPPDTLPARIRAALRQADQEARPARRRWRLIGLAASVAAVLMLSVAGLAALWPASAVHERLVQEVIDSHIRSQLADRHLLDVESSDRHTVKPWFQGKVDFAPSVRDLSDDGFVLAGGRLDYVHGRPIAALVYRRRQHVINLLLWPAAAGEKETPVRHETRQGYHLIYWRRQGMTGWAVSDLNASELAEFARLFRGRE